MNNVFHVPPDTSPEDESLIVTLFFCFSSQLFCFNIPYYAGNCHSSSTFSSAIIIKRKRLFLGEIFRKIHWILYLARGCGPISLVVLWTFALRCNCRPLCSPYCVQITSSLKIVSVVKESVKKSKRLYQFSNIFASNYKTNRLLKNRIYCYTVV